MIEWAASYQQQANMYQAEAERYRGIADELRKERPDDVARWLDGRQAAGDALDAFSKHGKFET